jgi:16S rRNA G1207 methylase RsmC
MVRNNGLSHYYSEEQKSPLNLRKVKDVLRNNSLEFYTGSGVFSLKKIDKGTKLLTENAIMQKDWKVLDIGCGYGVIGISIAKAFPETSILMTDINRRAIKLAKMNLELNLIPNAEVRQSNLYENIEEKFNTILVNPPQTAGKDMCFEIIEKAKDHLEKHGLFQLVARHNKGGKQLSKKMEEVYNNVKDIAKKGGYRVYVSEKK